MAKIKHLDSREINLSDTVHSAPNSKWLRIFAWSSFVLNVLIIATGGTVRLTSSGLGCSEWPVCTPGSLVPTPELGIHGVIEFANRTISGPLLIAALAVVLLSFFVTRRRDLRVLSLVVFLLVLAQAFVGAFVVWLHLDANLVGVHYVISLIIVCITTAYLVLMKQPHATRELQVPVAHAVHVHIATVFMALTIFVGVMTTGAGPHSGDDNVQREGIDATLLAHFHSWPGYVTLALIVALVVWASVAHLQTKRWAIVTLCALIVQIVVGVYQARNGLPPFAVGVHMVLASLTAASMTVIVFQLKKAKTASSERE